MCARGMRDIFLVIFYLTSMSSAISNHEPKVYEYNDENPEYPMAENIRTPRHLDASQPIYQPPVFLYETATQQDRLKARYFGQQRSDSKSLKNPMGPDAFFQMHKFLAENRGELIHIPFEENFQHNIQKGHSLAKDKPAMPKKLEINTIYKKNPNNDLNFEESRTVETQVKADREDKNTRYIYVQPDLLEHNFGLDAKVTKQILKNAAPMPAETKYQFEIADLQNLLHQNPEFQLEGLQKLLEEEKPIIHSQIDLPTFKGVTPSHMIKKPPIEELQKQFDSVAQLQSNDLFAEAQKQADLHVQAQHKAIMMLQKQAEEAAWAKINAHNQGISTIRPEDSHQISKDLESIINSIKLEQNVPSFNPKTWSEQNSSSSNHPKGDVSNSFQLPETLALYDRPTNHVELTNQNAPSNTLIFNDLRAPKQVNIPQSKVYQPAPFHHPKSGSPKIKLLSEGPSYRPQIHKPTNIQSNTLSKPEVTSVHRRAKQDPQANVRVSRYSGEKKLNYDDHQQYAAKYAFGYRVIDEKTGNDFGHEEERNEKDTKGHYFVNLPDGRKQKVEYYADDNGYHAKVTYENPARHHHVSENFEHKS